ncbi:ABC transporter permease [Crateriforma conspicua]|uniref:ABC-2 family transporter protein n=1 Tax=Crateriforma conspicua TaxID=2527996 RepID=A0A5C5Y5F1_9PLAN|nr:ABC transporter permease [Crateriforma conspicua]TWT70450.1 ABC-2 family transporter protein [Crateriforma conspicua]
MYLRNNPVLQRELLVNLRTNKSFLLLAGYQLMLSLVVLAAWPADRRLDLTSNPESASRLVNLFFLGQYVIASLIAPSFSAGAVSGEKERQTYEMLLASPMRPGAIVFGKMVASLLHLGLLVIASLPIIALCLPLGGVSLYEVIAAYVGLLVSVVLYGAIGVFCSSYFTRTSSSIVVSYLAILPLVLAAITFWMLASGEFRLKVSLLVVPAFAIAAIGLMCANAAARMLYPPDFGSEGKEVIDLEREAEEAVGLVIQPDQFPDRLFAPPKKQELMADGTNPVYDKELHSEIFSQGTLMLRLVIQISMLLAIPLMGLFLFFQYDRSPWFVVYVIVFNLLVGPVFLAGSMTSERERQTLDLLLTTTLTPWQILSGKFIVGFRISFVLTSFLLWPLLLGTLMNDVFYTNWMSVLGMFAIVVMASLVNAFVALTCSLFCRRTSVSLIATYVVLLTLYVGPPALVTFSGLVQTVTATGAPVQFLGIASPFSALFALPLDGNLMRFGEGEWLNPGNLTTVYGYFGFSAAVLAVTSLAMWTRLNARRGLSE